MIDVLAQQAPNELLDGLASVGAGLGYGLAAIGQPEAAGMVRTTMFLGIAFTEALALIGFVVFILIKFT